MKILRKLIDIPDDDVIDCNVNFGSSIKYINTNNLRRVNLGCSFGAMKVYFDNAKIDLDKAFIYLDISFSGVELYIPKDWNITNSANINLAGIEEKNRKSEISGPTLILTGNVRLSNIQIIYV